MTTKVNRHYRLSIPLTDRTKEVLDRLAVVYGSSAGKTAGMLLDNVTPQLEQLAEVMEQVRSNPMQSADLVLRMVSGLQEELSGYEKDGKNGPK